MTQKSNQELQKMIEELAKRVARIEEYITQGSYDDEGARYSDAHRYLRPSEKGRRSA